MSIVRDMSQQRAYEDSLTQKEREMALAQEIGNFGHWRIHIADQTVFWSDALYRIHGRDPAGPKVTLEEATQHVSEPDRDQMINQINQTIITRQPHHFEVSLLRLDGESRIMFGTMKPELDDNGRVVSVFGVAHDVTSQRSIEERLRQSQKMEAVGQLTGGVAHDFNNLLAVIQGNAELLIELLDDIEDSKKDQLQAIMRASERGADLTNNMLAFSRKQSLRPSVLHLNQVVENMIRILARTIGEQIELVFVPSDHVWPCTADSSQLESALLNLALNARDAMPDGGTLTITTNNIRISERESDRFSEFRPGDYVLLTVSDTGIGIDHDNQPRVFEPFYTTKDVGKGTGLGLSMVYGFIKQSGGHIVLDSDPGQGTTLKLFLPRGPAQVAQQAVIV
jgi:PAS domain S-box-containing protein